MEAGHPAGEKTDRKLQIYGLICIPVGLFFLIQYPSSIKCETLLEQESEAMLSFLIVKYSNHRTTETGYSTSVFLRNGNLP